MNRQLATVAQDEANSIWILICGFLVFLMQAGFALLEAGSVRAKNVSNILFKNLMDVCIAGMVYFLVSYAWAYGNANASSTSSKFIGTGNYALVDNTKGQTNYSSQGFWFFQFAFAATAATIVSGAVAERTKIEAYFIFSFFITFWIYPIVTHWVWAGQGWLSAFSRSVDGSGPNNGLFNEQYTESCGMFDYAGSSVVHMVGGLAGLIGAIVVGPRTGRFVDGKTVDMPGHSMTLSTLGTLILWFGWYGFNCGSTLAFDPTNAAKVAVTTTLGPCSAVLTGVILNYARTKTWDLGLGLNCALAGLVSVTANCSIIEDWMAIFIGMIGAFIYLGSSALLKKLQIDDPLDAFPVHGACGAWGTLAVGIFSTQDNIANAYSCPCYDARFCSNFPESCCDQDLNDDNGFAGIVANGKLGNSTGWTFLIQLCGVLTIATWTVGWSLLLFYGIKFTIGMRVSQELEDEGMDISEHGGSAYNLEMTKKTVAAESAETAATAV